MRLSSRLALTTAFPSLFSILLFAYFATTCGELLNIKFVIFRLKMNFLFGFLLFFLCSKELLLIKKYLIVFVVLLISILASLLNSAHIIACTGFLFFYIFTYFSYFVVPTSLMKYNPEKIL